MIIIYIINMQDVWIYVEGQGVPDESVCVHPKPIAGCRARSLNHDGTWHLKMGDLSIMAEYSSHMVRTPDMTYVIASADGTLKIPPGIYTAVRDPDPPVSVQLTQSNVGTLHLIVCSVCHSMLPQTATTASGRHSRCSTCNHSIESRQPKRRQPKRRVTFGQQFWLDMGEVKRRVQKLTR